MKFKKIIPFFVAVVSSVWIFTGCSDVFTNPGDSLGGGGTVSSSPSESDSENAQNVEEIVAEAEVDQGETAIPDGATEITADNLSITEAGDYYVKGELSGKINVKSAGVTLYLSNAYIANEKKVIESENYGLTITLIGENTIENSNAGGSNAIDVVGDLIINGSGSLTVSATKNAIKGNSISVVGATLCINAEKDGLHAEVDAYDVDEEEPVPSYSDGGFVYLSGANIEIVSAEDGIQADTFVYIADESEVEIIAGGGAPATITETSSDNASGKGIKAGQIDWGTEGTDLDWDGYMIYIESGNITVNSNDDSIHSNGELVITGGTFDLTSGDDAIHSDNLLQIYDGTIAIDKCYEGIESAKVEISGGTIEIQTYEDGINAADGSQTTSGTSNSNCHIIITGGYISVNCVGSEGDGIDSNGTILISGGEVYVAGSSNSSDAALDSEGGILINGGYVFAVGALGMVETPASNSAQYCVSFARNQSISAGTVLYLCDSSGNIIMYFETPRSCQSVIISCPELESGKTYTIYGGNSLLASFTISSTITSVGSSSSISNPGGTPNGNQPGANIPGFGNR